MQIKERLVKEYITSDGTIFQNQIRAEQHEKLCELVSPVIDLYPKVELKSRQYLYIGNDLCDTIRRKSWDIVISQLGDEWPEWRNWKYNEVHPLSIVGRVLDDYGGPLNTMWRKLAFINFEHGTLHDQPYFANHFNECQYYEQG